MNALIAPSVIEGIVMESVPKCRVCDREASALVVAQPCRDSSPLCRRHLRLVRWYVRLNERRWHLDCRVCGGELFEPYFTVVPL